MSMNKLLTTAFIACLWMSAAQAKEFIKHESMMNHGDGHMMDMGGAMVMGNNEDVLPGGCDKISATKEITVRAGHKYAEKFPGRTFAFDQQEYHFDPCTKLTVHFINEDEIRHQWMMHGLPKYLYPKGMFHLEVTGPGQVSGTLILPAGDKTYLVHCDIAQHMEKGMKAQLKVGQGSGDLPSIPGVTANVIQDDYSDSIPDTMPFPKPVDVSAVGVVDSNGATASGDNVSNSLFSGMTVIGLAIGLLAAPFLAKKYEGMSFGEGVAYTFEVISQAISVVVKFIGQLIKKFTGNKTIELPDK